ncbi:putative flavonoid 3-hydroxylase [Xylaria grammica]|nr:putative flavonoid 3-hydroxylase [Xylaria grammica]
MTEASVTGRLMAMFGLAVLYVVALLIYRLYFHPLAKFPGPRLPAATSWYEAYFDLFTPTGGQFMYEIKRMHEVYGPIVRINPHELHVSDPEWLDTIFCSPKHGHRDKYAPSALLTGLPKGVFGTIPHQIHRKRRAAINPLFSKANAAAALSMIYDNADLLMKRIEAQIARDGHAEMRTNYLAYATDNVAEYFLEDSFHLLDDEEKAEDWHKSMRALANTTPAAKQFSWVIPLSFKLPATMLRLLSPDAARIVNMHREMENQAARAIRKREQEGREKALPQSTSELNIFRTILDNNELPLAEKAFDRISHEGVVVLGAGGETVSTTLAVGTYFVLACRDVVQPRLNEELREVMPTPDTRPSLRELERLPWLTAVIKEVLRISVLVTSRFPLISKTPLRYKDWTIPPGTPVGMTLSEILMDASIFTNPRDFQPSRWLDTPLNANPNREKMNHAFVPFSRGNRMCMGVNLAWAELYVAFAVLLRGDRFQLHETVRERDVDVARDCFIGAVSADSKGIRIKYRDS